MRPARERTSRRRQRGGSASSLWCDHFCGLARCRAGEFVPSSGMPKFRYLTADVFTDVPFGGNQLAVFPDARGIPEHRLLDITREFNYSETTFVYPPADPSHARHVRIFTPGGE